MDAPGVPPPAAGADISDDTGDLWTLGVGVEPRNKTRIAVELVLGSRLRRIVNMMNLF